MLRGCGKGKGLGRKKNSLVACPIDNLEYQIDTRLSILFMVAAIVHPNGRSKIVAAFICIAAELLTSCICALIN